MMIEYIGCVSAFNIELDYWDRIMYNVMIDSSEGGGG